LFEVAEVKQDEVEKTTGAGETVEVEKTTAIEQTTAIEKTIAIQQTTEIGDITGIEDTPETQKIQTEPAGFSAFPAELRDLVKTTRCRAVLRGKT
jgi:acyl-[acyl carrier protein]--UDP-N-acetylglucosamine O-acyltransferase